MESVIKTTQAENLSEKKVVSLWILPSLIFSQLRVLT